MLCDLADALGLTDGLSAAMAPTKQRRRGHDRGRLLVDLAVMLADGGEALRDLAVLRDQPDLFGAVASLPTVWGTLEAIDEATLAHCDRPGRGSGTSRARRARGSATAYATARSAASRSPERREDVRTGQATNSKSGTTPVQRSRVV
jgi:hypothetical protein